jgi:hypothetical protein
LGLRWDYVRLENRFIILPITKNNTSRVVPINETLYIILSEMPEKTGYVFGNGNAGHVGDIKHSFTSAFRKAGITDFLCKRDVAQNIQNTLFRIAAKSPYAASNRLNSPGTFHHVMIPARGR